MKLFPDSTHLRRAAEVLQTDILSFTTPELQAVPATVMLRKLCECFDRPAEHNPNDRRTLFERVADNDKSVLKDITHPLITDCNLATRFEELRAKGGAHARNGNALFAHFRRMIMNADLASLALRLPRAFTDAATAASATAVAAANNKKDTRGGRSNQARQTAAAVKSVTESLTDETKDAIREAAKNKSAKEMRSMIQTTIECTQEMEREQRYREMQEKRQKRNDHLKAKEEAAKQKYYAHAASANPAAN